MTDTNPPQERAATIAQTDDLHERVKACLAELLREAEQYRLERARALSREFGREIECDSDDGDDGSRMPYDATLMERLNNEARLGASLHRSRPCRGLRI
jgi:hypothetical protein